MHIGHIKKALENRSVTTVDQIDELCKQSLSRLSVLASITVGDEKIINLPYDRTSFIAIDPVAVMQSAASFLKAIVKSDFAPGDEIEEAQLPYLDTYADGVHLQERKDADFNWAELLGSAAVPNPFAVTTDFPVAESDTSLIVLAGNKQSGKTLMNNLILRPDVIIRHGEPNEPVWDRKPGTIRASRFSSALFGYLTFGSVGLLTSIDSLKNETYRMEGAAAAGGVQPSLLLVLCDLSLLASYMKSSLITLINPLMTEEGMDFFVGQVDANVGGYIHMRQTGGAASVVSSFIRAKGERQDITYILREKLDRYTKSKRLQESKGMGRGVNTLESINENVTFAKGDEPFSSPNESEDLSLLNPSSNIPGVSKSTAPVIEESASMKPVDVYHNFI
jgi:hypothetical protein